MKTFISFCCDVGKHKAGFRVTGHVWQQVCLLQVIPRFLEKVAQRACFQPRCSKNGYGLWRCSLPQLPSQLE